MTHQHDTGWTAVQRDVEMNFNPEKTSLQIKTDSLIGSEERIFVDFYNAEGDFTGGVIIYFTTPPTYLIPYCIAHADFPIEFPPATEKIWRITVTKTSGIRLVIQCNDVEVLNFLMTDSTCTNPDWDWDQYWSRDVVKITFPALHDTASDFYFQPLSVQDLGIYFFILKVLTRKSP